MTTITFLLSISVVLCAWAGPEANRRNYVVTMSYGQADETWERVVEQVKEDAKQGNAKSQSLLGFMSEKGIGVAKDEEEAVKWYRKAAEQGNGEAQSLLGLMYAGGRGVAKNEAEAMGWFRKAAQSELQDFSKQPIHFAGGYEGAIRAAESGNALAQTMVGKMYLTGSGVAQNDVEAVRWLTEATKGFAAAGAQQALGLLYEEGRGGLPKDTAQAMRLYRKVAEQTAAGMEGALRIVYMELQLKGDTKP
jgi:TPR repeat protein